MTFAHDGRDTRPPRDGQIGARGSVLYQFDPARDRAWVALADLTAYGVSGISRLAVSRDGRMIALVAAE
jgi:hypothetical protein